VGWEGRDVWPDTDFTVVFSRTPNPLGIDLVTSRQPGEDGYFMLLASPGIAPQGAVQPKDVCFVLDTSGSMAGAKLEQAKKALQFCLANLGPDDRFEIVRFSTEAEPLFGNLVAADSGHLAKAGAFVDDLRPIGGTAIEEALSRALALRPSGGARDGARPYMVIFLTDGLPTIGETREDPLVDSLRNAGNSTRIFTFGIGTDVNTHLLDRVASSTRAVSQYVLPKEDIEVKVSSFYSKIKDPVLTNVSLAFTNPSVRVTQLLPSTLPDLFNGDMLVVFGRYSGSGAAAAKITGMFNGKQKEFAADVGFPAQATGDSYVPRLWATRRVGWLLDEMRLHGESAELKDEVTRLSRDFGIVTPYTAYLVVEDEARRSVPVNLRSFQEMEKDRDAMDSAKSRMDSVRREAAS
jgi:Ca-activated chloride channel homolog